MIKGLLAKKEFIITSKTRS